MIDSSQKTNNLLASVALFSNLYNNSGSSRNSVGDILSEFITAAIIEKNNWSVTSGELKYILEEMFGFDIPEAVIRSVLRNKFKNNAKNISGTFHFDKDALGTTNTLESERNFLKQYQALIVGKLVEYIEYNQPKLSIEDKQNLERNFYKFLMDNGVSEKYTDKISAFVLQNSRDKEFTRGLNLIREGLILYQGVRYSADLNSMGFWNTDLTLFLSPEHLLSALGYNGLVFKELFQDFYKLVNDINYSNKNRGSDKQIKLRYFDETKQDVDSLFNIASDIKRGDAKLTSHRSALVIILENSDNPSDIIEKRVKFYEDLKQMRIHPQVFEHEKQYMYSDYNVEDREVIDEVEKQSLRKTGKFDRQECETLLKIFTRINYFRGGLSKDKFENIGYIYISESSLALYLAHNNKVKFEEKDIPFAKNLEYITSTFWFKLKKGFGTDNEFPKSFDVVTKAQIILAGHTSNAVSLKYEKLRREYQEGKITVEYARELSNHLRENLSLPEDITADNVNESLEFITSDDTFNKYIREKERKERELKNAQAKITQLESEIAEKERIRQLEEDGTNKRLYESRKEEFCNDLWKLHVRENNKLLFLFFGVVVMTALPILLSYLNIKEFLNQSIYNWQLTTWLAFLAIVLIYGAEVFARTYLVNKLRVLQGWNWFKMLINNNKLRDYKDNKMIEFEENFNSENNI